MKTAICVAAGNPEYRQSIFCGIRRAELELTDFDRALASGRRVCIVCKSYGFVDLIRGTVASIVTYPNGKLVNIAPISESDVKWDIIPVWIPRTGTCGILATWRSNNDRLSRIGSRVPSPPAVAIVN